MTLLRMLETEIEMNLVTRRRRGILIVDPQGHGDVISPTEVAPRTFVALKVGFRAIVTRLGIEASLDPPATTASFRASAEPSLPR